MDDTAMDQGFEATRQQASGPQFASARAIPAGYDAAGKTAAWADLDGYGRLEVRGPDALTFLHNLCSSDLVKLPSGQGCEAFFLDLKGRIVAYAVVFKGDNYLWVDCGPGGAEKLRCHLERYAAVSDVTVLDRSSSHVHWHLVGPRATDLVHQAVELSISFADNLRFAASGSDDARLLVCRRDRSALPGYDLSIPRPEANGAWNRLTAVRDAFGLVDLSAEAAETLRIEAGLPVYGKDISDDNFPQEVGREAHAISFTKGCYLGQETVARIDALGHVNRKLTGLVIDGLPTATGVEVRDGERAVGTLTSSTFSPRRNATIGLAMLRAESATPGQRLTVVEEPHSFVAEVVSLPFVEALRVGA